MPDGTAHRQTKIEFGGENDYSFLKHQHSKRVSTKQRNTECIEKNRDHITDLVQLTAGMAYPFARACSNKLYKSSPVTTPAGTISLNDGMIV